MREDLGYNNEIIRRATSVLNDPINSPADGININAATSEIIGTLEFEQLLRDKVNEYKEYGKAGIK